jgi:hypothetical protein
MHASEDLVLGRWRTQAPASLALDTPSVTNDGRPKRWVVVRPPGAATGLLLARADGQDQLAVAGKQVAGRGRFLPPGRGLRRRVPADDRGGRAVRDAAAFGAVRPGRGVP